MSKLTVEQRIQKAHVWLMGQADYCLYSGVIMLGHTEVSDTVPTACTDGRNTRYGRKFCEGLDDKELRALILHENLHKAFSHLTTWRNLWDKNRKLANMACVVEGTLITMADGTLRRVEHVLGGELVKSPLGDAKVLLNTTTVKSDIIELVLSTGHKLTITSDHKVLTNEGFYEARQIRAGDLCAVDSGRASVHTLQLRDHDAARHGGLFRENLFPSIRGHECSEDQTFGVDCSPRSAGYGVPKSDEARGLGVSSGHSGRGGDYIGTAQEVSAPNGEGFKHELAAFATSGETRIPLDFAQQLGRTKVLHNRDIRVVDRALVSWDTSILDNQERISPVAIRNAVNTEANALQIQTFCADVGVSGSYKGYEYARVETVRRFTEERRVFDLTTTTQSFEANGVVTHNCDYVINLMIHDSDPNHKNVKLPEGGLLDERFRGMDAQTVFNILDKEQQGGGGGGSGGESGEGGEAGDGGEGGGLDDHDWEGANGMSPEDKEKLAHDIDQALRQGGMLAGRMKGNVPREITDALTPKVDWRAALREFVTSFCQDRDEATWRRPSRRWIGQDVYMPSMIGESVGRLAVCIDMSGSIGTAEIGQFLGEVKAICETVRPEGIDLLYWDTQVCRHETYAQDQLDQLVASTKPAGGGGTEPQCIPDFLNARKIKPECAVILTDGYVCSWGTGWPCPTLWGITTKNIMSPVGKSVSIV